MSSAAFLAKSLRTTVAHPTFGATWVMSITLVSSPQESSTVGCSAFAGDISSFFKPKACSQQRMNGTNDDLVEFIARDLRPISVVSGVGFK